MTIEIAIKGKADTSEKKKLQKFNRCRSPKLHHSTSQSYIECNSWGTENILKQVSVRDKATHKKAKLYKNEVNL